MNKKTYNVILDTPPDSFGGVAINTSFKTVLRFFRIMGDTEKDDILRAREIVNIFFKKAPLYDQEKMWSFFEWYITRGEESKSTGSKNLFDWDIDAGRVYAAFKQIYNIDLKNIDLHWWDFKDLFDALPAGTKLSEVIEIRSRKIDTKSDPKIRAELVKLKEAYSVSKNQKADMFPI